MKQSNLQRIKRVLDYYIKRGHNSEKINAIYFKILKDKLN
jgi:hypothetical protein